MSETHMERDLRFRDLLLRISKSPLYKEKLAGYDMESIRLDQMLSLPLTSKEDLRMAGAFGHLAVDMKEVAQYHESFGTTGEPSASWYTKEDLETGGRQMRDCGVRLTPDDIVLIRFPYAMSLPAFLMQHASRQAGSTTVPASSRTPVTPYPRVLELMRRLDVTVMAGLPREMELLAETARLLGSDAKSDFPALRSICAAGELMSEPRRKHIEKLWGVPVFNLYGSTETGNIAAMCEYGVMHIVEQDYVVEVLNENGSVPAAQGKRGFASVTTLSHQASPLLRYFNEDIITIEPCQCNCGRSGGSLVHFGRRKERISFGALVLDSKDIQDAVYSLSPAPDAWKVMEQENGLHFILDSHRSSEWSEENVRVHLTNLLGVPVTVEFADDGVLLDRGELVRNTPSKKPVYIQKLGLHISGIAFVDPVRDLLDQGRRKLAGRDFHEARALFEKAVALDANSADAHAWLAAAYGRLIEAGIMLEKMRLLPFLENEITAALAIDSTHPFARRINGARLLNTPETLGGDPAAAAKEFQYCIERGMDEADIWASLGECLIKMGEPEKAKAALKEALAREPKHEQAKDLMEQVS
ncbi:AMP-binding protein [Cohnella silvisoli]|uniref:AMP-binding protein n=1 Tax=Cohnella silvisoli TaxID=2873699 RepID=A0ABV1L2R3_9BACL|nr:AMP-binding protein [Cohnella silvisoli]MCD9026475.1 AMP-binding protein [Cohnella silvisoli]